ncbi:hypothetical protein HK097_003349, partial [Rhizophlyctis rosea]
MMTTWVAWRPPALPTVLHLGHWLFRPTTTPKLVSLNVPLLNESPPPPTMYSPIAEPLPPLPDGTRTYVDALAHLLERHPELGRIEYQQDRNPDGGFAHCFSVNKKKYSSKVCPNRIAAIEDTATKAYADLFPQYGANVKTEPETPNADPRGKGKAPVREVKVEAKESSDEVEAASSDDE